MMKVEVAIPTTGDQDLTGDFFTILLEMMKKMGHQIVFKQIITTMDP
jgi:hypothetical protein